MYKIKDFLITEITILCLKIVEKINKGKNRCLAGVLHKMSIDYDNRPGKLCDNFKTGKKINNFYVG